MLLRGVVSVSEDSLSVSGLTSRSGLEGLGGRSRPASFLFLHGVDDSERGAVSLLLDLEIGVDTADPG